MSRKRYTSELIIGLLREAEVLLSQGGKTAEVCRRLGISEQILIERWRVHYNTRRPHSALGYRPPAPEAVLISPDQAAYHRAQPHQHGWPKRQILSSQVDHSDQAGHAFYPPYSDRGCA